MPPEEPSPPAAARPPLEREPARWLRRAWLFGPLCATVALLAAAFALGGAVVGREVGVAALLSLAFGSAVVLGRAALGGQTVEHLSTWTLAAVVVYMTVVTAFFFSYNLDLLQRLRRVGPRLRLARMGAARTLVEHPWIRRLAVLGVGLFVLLPLPMSGSIGGSIVGRMVGLSRRLAFLTVSAAGACVCAAYAAFGEAVEDVAERHGYGWPVRVGTILVGLFVLSMLLRLVVRAVRTPPRPPPPRG